MSDEIKITNEVWKRCLADSITTQSIGGSIDTMEFAKNIARWMREECTKVVETNGCLEKDCCRYGIASEIRKVGS